MFIWITTIAVLVIGVALLIWYYATDEYDDWKVITGALCTICGAFAVVIVLGFQLINVSPTINNFIQQKAYIETHVSDNAIEDAALTTKKVELNDWLYNTQYWLTYRNGWSLYPDSVLDLEPID